MEMQCGNIILGQAVYTSIEIIKNTSAFATLSYLKEKDIEQNMAEHKNVDS
jgi:hypothetical protein